MFQLSRRGKYNNRIKIEEETSVRDPETKLNVKTWVTIHQCWSYIPQTSNIKSLYQAAVAHLEHAMWFEIRYKDGLIPGMRVVFKEKSYVIEDVKMDHQRKEFTLLQCKEVV